MTRPQLSYAFSYGFLGGPGHSYQFRRFLNRAGFTPAKILSQADIIIAHSAGCYLLPSQVSSRLIIYVGMPLNNEHILKTYKAANLENWREFIQNHNILGGTKGLLLCAYYGLTQPKRNWRIIRNSKLKPKVSIFPKAQILFIANHFDPWPKILSSNTAIYKKDWTFLSLGGTHDNIWENPNSYVEIIRRFVKDRA